MKKQMLNEGEIRKMMKFANIQKLTENFLDTQIAEEEELELGAEEEEELPLGDDEGALELDAEEEIEIEPEGPKSNEEIAQQLAAGVADLLSQVLDVNVESETDDSLEDDGLGEPEAEVEVEDELDVDVEEPGARNMYEEEDTDSPGLEKLDEEDAEELDKEDAEELDEGGETHKGKKKKTSGPKRGEKKGDEAFKNEDLVNEITRRVASRLLALKNK